MKKSLGRDRAREDVREQERAEDFQGQNCPTLVFELFTVMNSPPTTLGPWQESGRQAVKESADS